MSSTTGLGAIRTAHVFQRSSVVVALVAVLGGCSASSGPTGSVESTSAATASPQISAAATPIALPPDGSWQVDLTAEELIAAGAPVDDSRGGVFTYTFDRGRATIDVRYEDGGHDSCDGSVVLSGDVVRVSYDQSGACGNEVDSLRWALDDVGLHLTLVDAPLGFNKAFNEAKPWQSVEGRGPLATAVPWLSQCELGCQGPVARGTFTSAGFLPGLEMTFVDDTWFNTADYHDEIQFERGLSVLRFWQTAGASSENGELLSEVPQAPSGLTDWFIGNSDMVVSKPMNVTVGDGIAATTFNFRISDTNVNVDPDCPSGVRSCLNVLWIAPGHVFAIGYGEAVQLYLFTVGTGSDIRTIVVSLDASHFGQLPATTKDVAPILKSIRFPPSLS